jgi:hypothetical protein
VLPNSNSKSNCRPLLHLHVSRYLSKAAVIGSDFFLDGTLTLVESCSASVTSVAVACSSFCSSSIPLGSAEVTCFFCSSSSVSFCTTAAATAAACFFVPLLCFHRVPQNLLVSSVPLLQLRSLPEQCGYSSSLPLLCIFFDVIMFRNICLFLLFPFFSFVLYHSNGLLLLCLFCDFIAFHNSGMHHLCLFLTFILYYNCFSL